MLEHLSPKFKMPPMEREPRAALILNRFTRTLTVMFATNAISQLLGLGPEEIKGKSFYECIAENCLADAIQCLESAKANDSIAYLRFWYRDPRRENGVPLDDGEGDDGGEDEDDGESASGLESSSGGESMDEDMEVDDEVSVNQESVERTLGLAPQEEFDQVPSRDRSPGPMLRRREEPEPAPPFELEAVVSCTSDGLVVVLRKARPPIPPPHPPLLSPFDFENGLFAAPWGQQPIRPYYPPEMLYTFRPPLLPQFMPLRESVKAAGGPPLDQLMRSIQDVAVFAWALVGINGNLASYAHGIPQGDAQPQDGLPVWDNDAGAAGESSCLANSSEPDSHRWGLGEHPERGKPVSSSANGPPPFLAMPPMYQARPPPPAFPPSQRPFDSAYSPSTQDSAGYRDSFPNATSWRAPDNMFSSSPPSLRPFGQPRQAPDNQTPRLYGEDQGRWSDLSLSYTPSSGYPVSASPPSDYSRPRNFRPWQ